MVRECLLAETTCLVVAVEGLSFKQTLTLGTTPVTSHPIDLPFAMVMGV